jgi:Lon protease-like protein
MMEDALARDALMAIGLLEPGWEVEYAARPPVAPVVCLGRIVTHHRLDDGRYNLLLAGLRRGRITRELPPLRSFREIELELLEDENPADTAAERADLARRLFAQLRRAAGSVALAQEQVEQIRSGQAPLGFLADILAYTAELPLADKQRLLAETNVNRRALMLMDLLAIPDEDDDGGGPLFPFSDN